MLLCDHAKAVADPGAPGDAPAGEEDDRLHRERHHWALAVAETAGVLAIGTGWYWYHTDLNRADWELHWDTPSWLGKLRGDYLVLDTNSFGINAVRHPFGGAVLYQIGRANGLGPWGATLATLLGSSFWEYVIEFKEQVSINDQIVTTWSGLGLGEPLFQLGRFGLRDGASLPHRILGYLLSPFDAANVAAGQGAWSSGDHYWHRFQLVTGGGEQRDGDARRTQVRLAADLELVHDRRYGRAGHDGGRVRLGAWSRARVDVGVDPDARRHVVGTEVRTETWLTGWYTRRLDDAPGGPRGWGLLAGLAGGFAYDVRRLAHEDDQLNVMQLPGPRLELGLYRGASRATLSLAAYPDFAAVQAHVFGPVPPSYPPGMYSVLASNGYYFAVGVTGAARVVVETPRFSASVEARADAFRSIDGRARAEPPPGTEIPKDVEDQRAEIDGWLGVRLLPGPVAIGARGGAVLRRGTWRDQVRQTTSGSLGVELRVVF